MLFAGFFYLRRVHPAPGYAMQLPILTQKAGVHPFDTFMVNPLFDQISGEKQAKRLNMLGDCGAHDRNRVDISAFEKRR